MSSTEKPPNHGRPATVSPRDSGSDAIASHKDDIFFAAMQTTRMPMLVTDPHRPDNPIIFANRAFLSMTGYTPEELMGRNCRFLQGRDTDRLTVASIREAVAARKEISTEILNYRKDGSSFWNALFVSPVFDTDGRLVYFFASQLDVSRRRDAEEALAHVRKMEAIGQLTGGIAHDFNNLLQVMSSHLELLDRKLKKEPVDTAAAMRSVASSRNAVTRAATLTQQLLAFSRKQRLTGRPINLNAVANELTSLARESLGADVQVQLALDAELPNCTIDPSQIETALLNVVLNARDAMPHGGTVTLSTRAFEVDADDSTTFQGLGAGSYVSIAVRDTGVGIPPDVLSHVTEPFFTTKEEGRGTGLGLSMVYGFAKQSGGALHIDSEVGVGTTVRLFFPATPSDQVQELPAVDTADARGGDEIVLAVDDREEVLAVTRTLLESLGYVVHTAANGRAALEVLDHLPADARPRLLFSDIIMPGGMNGIVLARECLRRIPNLRVLLTTGFSDEQDHRAEDSGPEFEVLRKPFRLTDLAKKIRMVLDGPTGAGA